MIKCLSNACLEFDKEDGTKATTTIGFCELPDWVEKTDFYKLAALHKVITPFVNNDEKILKENEATQKENAELKAKLEAAEMALEKANTEQAMKEAAGIKDTTDSQEVFTLPFSDTVKETTKKSK